MARACPQLRKLDVRFLRDNSPSTYAATLQLPQLTHLGISCSLHLTDLDVTSLVNSCSSSSSLAPSRSNLRSISSFMWLQQN